MSVTDEVDDAIHQHDRDFAVNAMPLLVALSRYIDWVAANYTEPTEMVDFLFAKGLMLDLDASMSSRTVSEERELLMMRAEEYFEAYLDQDEIKEVYTKVPDGRRSAFKPKMPPTETAS